MNMLAKFIAILILSVGLLTGGGCALFTTEAVTAVVGKEAGKRVVKKVKEDHEERKRARNQGRDDGGQRE